ncbi:MAG TPA: MmcQ/YjbR family DNA-binding protein [Sporichthya sp.]|nr:MmcQ/YjbR family DNA-binding protein [Sporichthya sp.]
MAKKLSNMARLEATALALPEAERVNIEAWGDHPTFRVRNKNFVFCDQAATHLTVKVPVEEAAALVATRAGAEPAGYGLGRSGWVALELPDPLPDAEWTEIAELIETSYRLVAPKTLVRKLDSA